MLPFFRPSLPPFSIYRFLPDCNRNEILSRSNCAQVESVAIIIGAKRDGCPFSSNNVSCSFCMWRLMPQSMSSLTEASTSNALRPNLDSSLTSRIPMRLPCSIPLPHTTLDAHHSSLRQRCVPQRPCRLRYPYILHTPTSP